LILEREDGADSHFIVALVALASNHSISGRLVVRAKGGKQVVGVELAWKNAPDHEIGQHEGGSDKGLYEGW
jgi:hypothetical protein